LERFAGDGTSPDDSEDRKNPAEHFIGKLFAPAYKHVQNAVQNHASWTSQHRFYLDTRRSALRIEAEDVSWTLFRYIVKEGKGSFVPDEAALRVWNVPASAMDAARAALEAA
jgi:hypothetical protein